MNKNNNKKTNIIFDVNKKNFQSLLNWVNKNDEKTVGKFQEQYITVISLIEDKKFLKKIIELRQRLKIPKDFFIYGNNKDRYAEYCEYIDKFPEAVQNSYNTIIIRLCHQFNIDWKLYGDMIIEFLYFDDLMVAVPPDYEWFEYHFTPEEYRYKTKIELDYGEAREKIIESEIPIKLSLRIYKDTTKTKLISFIEKNWEDISKVKDLLNPYPLSKKYKFFKRDIIIYILYSIGLNTEKILNELSDKYNTNDSKEYYLENTAIRQIITDFKKRIKSVRA